MARLASTLPSSQLDEVGLGPALVAHPEVDQALLVVGVVAHARREGSPRSSEPKICSSISTSSCGDQGEDLQRLQRLGEDLGVAPLVRHLGQVHRAGVPEVQVDEAAGEEVLRPGVVLVGGRSGLDEGVERPRRLLLLVVEVVLQRGVEGVGIELGRRLGRALRRRRSAGRRLRRSLSRWRRGRGGGGGRAAGGCTGAAAACGAGAGAACAGAVGRLRPAAAEWLGSGRGPGARAETPPRPRSPTASGRRLIRCRRS